MESCHPPFPNPYTLPITPNMLTPIRSLHGLTMVGAQHRQNQLSDIFRYVRRVKKCLSRRSQGWLLNPKGFYYANCIWTNSSSSFWMILQCLHHFRCIGYLIYKTAGFGCTRKVRKKITASRDIVSVCMLSHFYNSPLIITG
jgi:hypothetical protein